MLIQIETATTSCSVALAKDGLVLGSRQVNERNKHAEVITVFIDELIRSVGVGYNDIDAIAVSSGPGSYTGLRIGVSTAKGLCFALDKPLIAVDTLAAMAYGITLRGDVAIAPGMILCPMIDARRMEVYTAIYTVEGENIKPTAAEIIDAGSFKDLLADKEILFFGDGAEKCRDVLGVNPNARFYSNFENSATDLTQKAAERFAREEFENIALFEPFYLKDFIAGKKAF